MPRPFAIHAAILLAAFIVFTLVVAFVDRASIGPDGVSTVGLSHLNRSVQRLIGRNQTAYRASKCLGLLALATVPFYAAAGLFQLIRRRSLKALDRSLIILALYYLLIALCYLFFEKLAINYRPVFEADGTLEPSYPSSHTLLGICLPGASLLICRHWLKEAGHSASAVAATVLHLLISLGIVLCRLLSGVHWFTDIIGSILLALALLFAFAAARLGGLHLKKK